MRILNFSIFFTLIFVNPVFSQNESLQVLHLKGEIFYLESNTPLAVGDIISENSKLKFKNDKDLALVISNKRGRLVLFKNEPEINNEKELGYVVKSNILPVNEYTGTRNLAEENYTYIVFDENNDLIHPKQIKVSYIPKNEKSYYFLEYVNHDEDVIKIPLSLSESNSLNISNKNFELIDNFNPKLMDEVKIKLYSAEKEKELTLKGLNVKGIQIQDIVKEVQIYSDYYKTQAKSMQYPVVKEYLQEVYGNLDKEIIDLIWKLAFNND